MNRIEANEFAAKWISAWNRKDVNAVLEHYVDDAKFVSPKAATFVGSSLVEGKPSLSQYWQLAAKKRSNSLWIILSCVFCSRLAHRSCTSCTNLSGRNYVSKHAATGDEAFGNRQVELSRDVGCADVDNP